jgi:hypothetical protein
MGLQFEPRAFLMEVNENGGCFFRGISLMANVIGGMEGVGDVRFGGGMGRAGS